ncbi:MAG: phosphatase PAP2 family protein [Ilumatobacteraceae bacterium]
METYTKVDDARTPNAPSSGADGAGPGRKHRRLAWLREVAIVVVFYYVYQTIRSIASHGSVDSRAYSNADRLVSLERFLHIYSEQTVQAFFLSQRWFIKILNVYYGTLHFAITIGLLVWIYHFRHTAYRRMRNLLGITTALALIGYWAFPLAPPRLMKTDKFVDTLETVGGLWSYTSPVAKAVANQFAAMPSLHFGWALWCGIVFYTLTTHRATRSMIVFYPLLTLTAIVVTANHFWLDAVGGAVILVAALGINHVIERLLTQASSRRRPPAIREPDPPSDPAQVTAAEQLGSVPPG